MNNDGSDRPGNWVSERTASMDRELRLARVFVELADTMVAEFDVIDFLHTLADRIVELLGADAAGLMVADQRGSLRLIASSAESARLLEVFELQNSEGPCLDCFRTGERLINLDDTVMQTRWPNFWAQTKQLGFRSAHALPMRLRDEVIGAVNLFSRTGTPLSEQDVAVGQAMADVATIGLLQERSVRQKDVLAEQLQTALTSRVLIEQAKGVLAERAQISIEDAFTTMRAQARRRGVTLTKIATDVISASPQAAEL
jgi:transcriptional regulator with GAF, ATPase, and Fis domain